MVASISIADPRAVLMLSHLDVDADGRVRTRHDGLRRRQRNYQRRAWLRKLLA